MRFADTSALFAFLVADDIHHPEALRAEASIRANREAVWTIDPVLTELWLLLRREVSPAVCDRLVGGLLDRGLRREQVQPGDYDRAWEIGRTWADQAFSLTDRQAFVALERSGDLRAWSYDQDFATIRLGPRRDRRLQLLR